MQAPLHANTDIIRSIVCTEQGFIFTVSYDRCIMIYEVSAASGPLLSGASMNGDLHTSRQLLHPAGQPRAGCQMMRRDPEDLSPCRQTACSPFAAWRSASSLG